MTYDPQQWEDDNTEAPYGPLSAARLQHIEDGLAALANEGAYVTVTGTYTITLNNGIIGVDGTSGTFTVTLPSAVGIGGRSYTIKKIDASGNTVTVSTTLAQLIDDSPTYDLAQDFSHLTVVSNGSNWLIVAN